jgi:hypothetical protein
VTEYKTPRGGSLNWLFALLLPFNDVEWVAQVSLLRPGYSGRTDFLGETQVSKARPGPPT